MARRLTRKKKPLQDEVIIGDYIVVDESCYNAKSTFWTAAVVLAVGTRYKRRAPTFAMAIFGKRWKKQPPLQDLAQCSELDFVQVAFPVVTTVRSKWLKYQGVHIVRPPASDMRSYVAPLLRDVGLVGPQEDGYDVVDYVGPHASPSNIITVARCEDLTKADFLSLPRFRGFGFPDVMDNASLDILEYPEGHYQRDVVTERTLRVTRRIRRSLEKKR